MVQLELLNGRNAGQKEVFKSFPCLIGRASAADLRTEENGVWDRHVEIRLGPEQGFSIHPQAEAPVEVNGSPVREALLRNGDIIQIGFSKVLFRISPTRQKNLLWREIATWLCLALLPLIQLFLVYYLIR